MSNPFILNRNTLFMYIGFNKHHLMKKSSVTYNVGLTYTVKASGNGCQETNKLFFKDFMCVPDDCKIQPVFFILQNKYFFFLWIRVDFDIVQVRFCFLDICIWPQWFCVSRPTDRPKALLRWAP